MASRDLDFGHGKHYGDYSGITFYGSPENGFWLDSLAVSDAYIRPLFQAILQEVPLKVVVNFDYHDKSKPPQIVKEWNELTGWTVTGLNKPIPACDVVELVESLTNINANQIASFCNGCSPEECLSCASMIKQYLDDHIAKGIDLYMEQD